MYARQPDPPHRACAPGWVKSGCGAALRCVGPRGAEADADAIRVPLHQRASHPEVLVREHVAWALA